MAKIQLKKSVILNDDGKAKEPTSGQMQYGELAVNFNENDPSIFMKDSDDKIIRIAGINASGSAAPGVNEDITALKSLSTPITLAQGGTGADDSEEGLSNLKGIKEVKNAGSTGESLVVAESTNTDSTSYRAELKSITAKNNGGIAVTTVGKSVEISSIPEDILGTLPEDGVIDINKTRFKNAAAPIDPQDLATRKYVDDLDIITNLSLSKDANTVTVKSSTGADTTISTATNTSAGVLTASDYVRLDDLADGRNNSYLAKNGKADTAGVADNSLKLGGKVPSDYLTKTEKAATAALADNSTQLGGLNSTDFLRSNGKALTCGRADVASNSDNLGGKAASTYTIETSGTFIMTAGAVKGQRLDYKRIGNICCVKGGLIVKNPGGSSNALLDFDLPFIADGEDFAPLALSYPGTVSTNLGRASFQVYFSRFNPAIDARSGKLSLRPRFSPFTAPEFLSSYWLEKYKAVWPNFSFAFTLTYRCR